MPRSGSGQVVATLKTGSENAPAVAAPETGCVTAVGKDVHMAAAPETGWGSENGWVTGAYELEAGTTSVINRVLTAVGALARPMASPAVNAEAPSTPTSTQPQTVKRI